MPDLTLIILSAGNSTRFNRQVKKQWLRIDKDPLWLFVAKKFQKYSNFEKIIITASKDEISYMSKFASYVYVKGGNDRQDSLKNALQKVTTKYVLVTDVARACIDKKMLDKILSVKCNADVIVPYLSVSDTVVYNNQTINRDQVKLIQTPQLSLTSKLKEALEQNKIFTDESSAIKSIGGEVYYVKGSQKAKKITHSSDLEALECLKKPTKSLLIGTGFDVHEFCENKKMFLGGVEIDSKLGFKAHSDGDVALHALIDALLGAAGAGDIGELFPDTDEKYNNIDSKIMLKDVVEFIHNVGLQINNVDITILAQSPKLSPYKLKMSEVISSILQVEPIMVNIKATTTEKLGFIGRKEGVAVEAVATLKYYNWTGK